MQPHAAVVRRRVRPNDANSHPNAQTTNRAEPLVRDAHAVDEHHRIITLQSQEEHGTSSAVSGDLASVLGGNVWWSNEDLLEAARRQTQIDGNTNPITGGGKDKLQRPLFCGMSPSSAPANAAGVSPTGSPSPPADSTPTPDPPRRGSSTTPQQFLRSFVSDNPWDTLHAQPALAVVGGTTALSMISAYILQNHVLETQDHLGVFLFGSYLIFSSYFMVYYFLERFSTSFRKISQDKKFYTIGNLLKAGVLVSITPFAVYNLLLVLVYDTWETNTLRNLGCIYAIPDFVSMIVVRRMAWTTWLHHICVCLFNCFSIHNDYAQENVCRLIVVYAAFSTFAYCVNMLLASRFLGVSAQVSRVLSFVALCVYVFCCAVNWVWQAHYLRKLIRDNDHWTIYLYMTLICFVMWDDIVLNRWLLQNARNTHGGILLSSTASAAVAPPSGKQRGGIRGACC